MDEGRESELIYVIFVKGKELEVIGLHYFYKDLTRFLLHAQHLEVSPWTKCGISPERLLE